MGFGNIMRKGAATMKYEEWNWKTRDGLEMYAGEWLPEDKARGTICLVHGVGEHIGRYQWISETLNRAGYILTGFDLRGFGKSQGKRGFTPSLEAYFDDIDAFLAQVDQRHPGLPRFLLGHSMGATLVLVYPPARHPAIRGVIALAPGLKTQIGDQKLKLLLTKIFGKIYPTFTLPSGLDIPEICRDPQVIKDYINDPLVHTRATAGWGLAMLKALDLAYQSAPQFPVPLLLMHGTEDKVAYPSSSLSYAELAPKDKVTLKMWEGFKHELHNDPEREQVFKFIVEWLDVVVRE
jgi:alpha-beta hydrolase superfamily lysophospholipase